MATSRTGMKSSPIRTPHPGSSVRAVDRAVKLPTSPIRTPHPGSSVRAEDRAVKLPTSTNTGMSDRAKQAWTDRMQGQADFYEQHGYVPSDPNMARRAAGAAAKRAERPNRPDPMQVWLDEQRRRRDELNKRLNEATSRYKSLAQRELELALQALDAQANQARTTIQSQLDQLPGIEARQTRGIQDARRQAIRQAIGSAISQGRVGGGLQQQSTSTAIGAEAEAKSALQEDMQRRRNELNLALEQILAEIERERQARRLAMDRQIQTYELSALQTGLG